MEPVGTAVERLQKELDRLVPRNSNSQTFTLQTSSPVAWVCVIVTVISVMAAGFALYAASDAKNQGRADRAELLQKIQSLENTDNAIRAYINTGRMPVKKEDK